MLISRERWTQLQNSSVSGYWFKTTWHVKWVITWHRCMIDDAIKNCGAKTQRIRSPWRMLELKRVGRCPLFPFRAAMFVTRRKWTYGQRSRGPRRKCVPVGIAIRYPDLSCLSPILSFHSRPSTSFTVVGPTFGRKFVWWEASTAVLIESNPFSRQPKPNSNGVSTSQAIFDDQHPYTVAVLFEYTPVW